jgi:hypothetical protein
MTMPRPIAGRQGSRAVLPRRRWSRSILGAALALAGCGGASAESRVAVPVQPGPASAAAAPGTCAIEGVAACAGSPPSFTADVQPIVRKRCFGCHAAGGVAADEHDFDDVAVMHAQRATVASEVVSCSMPPRAPLREDEARVLLRWVACGGRTD